MGIFLLLLLSDLVPFVERIFFVFQLLSWVVLLVRNVILWFWPAGSMPSIQPTEWMRVHTNHSSNWNRCYSFWKMDEKKRVFAKKLFLIYLNYVLTERRKIYYWKFVCVFATNSNQFWLICFYHFKEKKTHTQSTLFSIIYIEVEPIINATTKIMKAFSFGKSFDFWNAQQCFVMERKKPLEKFILMKMK